MEKPVKKPRKRFWTLRDGALDTNAPTMTAKPIIRQLRGRMMDRTALMLKKEHYLLKLALLTR